MIPSKLKTDALVSPPATFSLLLPILRKSRPHQFTNKLHFAPSFPSNASCRWHHLTLLAPRSSFFSSSSSDSPPASSAELLELDFDAELSRFMAILPNQMRQRLRDHAELYQLIEVVMDLGRQPLARFPSGDFILADCPIMFQDLQHATTRVGDFDSDNRAGISRTLHRISAIKNRKGAIIGLTCRIGRAISGSASLLRDLIQHGASLLMIGPPGVGKTTIIRELARILANDFKKRVMVIDTSNEIGGDGDIPHAGIGNARRMQVPTSDMQHKVLIEAVENHMPQVIVIDEIGTKLEAMAASTIAQRGIQLVATAHGLKIENLILNPTLEMLVGGVQSVTLGDEEAGRRRMQKTVLERKGPSTFISAVEIVSKTELRIHHNLEATVDSILSGRSPYVEVRKVKTSRLGETSSQISPSNINNYVNSNLQEMSPGKMGRDDLISEFPSSTKEISCKNGAPFLLFVYGIPEESAKEGVRQLKLDDAVQLIDNISEADALLALQSKIKKNSGIHAVAKSRDIPIYVTKTTSLIQISKAIQALVNDHADNFKGVKSVRKMNLSENTDALEEARIAIEQVVIPRGEPVELLPRPPQILSLQMDLARKYQLQAETIGTELDEHICILPLLITPEKGQRTIETFDTKNVSEDLTSTDRRKNGSPFSAIKLPFLPE